jgi:hypothetical protein
MTDDVSTELTASRDTKGCCRRMVNVTTVGAGGSC